MSQQFTETEGEPRSGGERPAPASWECVVESETESGPGLQVPGAQGHRCYEANSERQAGPHCSCEYGGTPPANFEQKDIPCQTTSPAAGGWRSRSFQRDGETRPDMLVVSDLEVTVETEPDTLGGL